LEIGGTDQLFNLLAGRKIQESFGQPPQDIMTLKMVEGLSGGKMSTSVGNVINIIDSPAEMYGKVMSMRDELILKYFEFCTRVPLEEIKTMESALKEGGNSRDLKAKLAFKIVKIYHNEKEAQKAEQEFSRIFQKKETPENIPVFKVQKNIYKLVDLLAETKLAPTKSEARRLIEQGAVEIDGQVIKEWNDEIKLKNKMVIKVGKRRFIKLIH